MRRLLQGSTGQQRGGILESFISAFSSQIFTLWHAIKVMGWDSIIALKCPKFWIFARLTWVTPRCNSFNMSACKQLPIMEVRGQTQPCQNFLGFPELSRALHWSEHLFKCAIYTNFIHISIRFNLMGQRRKIHHIIWCFDKGWGWEDAEGLWSRVLPLSPRYTCRQSQGPHSEF